MLPRIRSLRNLGPLASMSLRPGSRCYDESEDEEEEKKRPRLKDLETDPPVFPVLGMSGDGRWQNQCTGVCRKGKKKGDLGPLGPVC